MKYDDILEELGEFGKYQKRVYILASLPVMFSAMHIVAGVFILATPNHRCALPGLANDTYAVQGEFHAALLNASVPRDGDAFSDCSLYASSDVTQANRSKVECDRYVYDQSIFKSTLITHLNLVCDRRPLVAHSTMILFAGLLVGSLLMGLLSDLIGRKKTFLIALAVQVGAGVGLAFVNNYSVFVTLRFLIGGATIGSAICLYVIGIELVGPNKRSSAGVAIWFLWVAGLFLLGILGYLIRTWHVLQLVISVPPVVFFSYWWVIPESPRWLVSKRRYTEATTIINRAARVNKVELSPKCSNLENIEQEKQERFWHMFTSPILVFRATIVFINWLVVVMIYYGLMLNVGSLVGDIFINYQIGTVVEFVSYLIIIPMLDKLGRKASHCSTMLIGGIACILTLFPVIYGDKSHEWITITLSMIGRFGATSAFATIYVFSAELFPTVLRNSTMGACSLCGRIGGMISPYIAELGSLVVGDWSKALPLVVFGALTCLGGILSLLLPETNKKQMPETIADAKRFGRSKPKNAYEMEVSTVDEDKKEKDVVPMEFIANNEKALHI